MHAQANIHTHESLYTTLHYYHYYTLQYICKHRQRMELTNSFDGDSLFLIAVPTLLAIDSLFGIGFSFSVLKR